ncbi:MAG: hypothetical protein HC905_25770 [Bacteroidales bacterium]|nr:hypothetical protein [Bacteroidales bacterium]
MMKKLVLFSLVGILACEESDQTLVNTDNQVITQSDTTEFVRTASEMAATSKVSGKYEIIYANNWENNPPGRYSYDQMKSEFNYGLYEWGLGKRTNIYDPKSCNVIKEGSSKFLRVSFPKGTYGANHGMSWEGELGRKYSELYLSYDIRFKPGFNFVKGGKLFGLSGGVFTVPDPPRGMNGFDALAMWKPDGTIQSYVYHHAYRSRYGEGGNWDPALSKLVPGKWYNITVRVVMNTVGKKNGIFEAFVNGRLVFSRQNYEFRKSNLLGIHKITFLSFFGGSSKEHASKQNEYIDFDNIRVFRYANGKGEIAGFKLSPAGYSMQIPKI